MDKIKIKGTITDIILKSVPTRIGGLTEFVFYKKVLKIDLLLPDNTTSLIVIHFKDELYKNFLHKDVIIEGVKKSKSKDIYGQDCYLLDEVTINLAE